MQNPTRQTVRDSITRCPSGYTRNVSHTQHNSHCSSGVNYSEKCSLSTFHARRFNKKYVESPLKAQNRVARDFSSTSYYIYPHYKLLKFRNKHLMEKSGSLAVVFLFFYLQGRILFFKRMLRRRKNHLLRQNFIIGYWKF